MNAIQPIAQTNDTVTLRRTDFERLLETLEDAESAAALRKAEAREAEGGKAAARADHLPVELVLRLVAGEHPVRIWREQRGLTLQALASQAGIGRSYLVEIEGAKKPGSVAAYRKLAIALRVAVDDLLPSPGGEADVGG
jgi:DNA-binding XRE family transcriptional regulator